MNHTRCRSLTILIIGFVCLFNYAISLPVSKLESQLEKPHSRVKRQYFKPSIDGSWIANERALLLKHSKMPTSTTTTTAASVALALKSGTQTSSSSSPTASTSTTAKNEVTVHSLAHSLINLFDRIKNTLCKIVNSECVNHGPTNPTSSSQPGRNKL